MINKSTALCTLALLVGTSAYAVTTLAFETDFTQAAEKTVNAVVCIKSYTTRQQNPYGQGGYDPFGMFDFFFGTPQQPRQQAPQQQRKKSEPVQSGLGSGVIISEDGYIVTNNHVVDGADKLEVLFNDNSSYDARIIGTDEASDLALIKVDAQNLTPITFGDSETVKIGEWVLAVGNPFGFNSTVTAGIVSAKARSLGQNHKGNLSIESFIQTDAALNPGNSGGALVNLKGELIGINSAIYSNTGSYSGFSFAIPTTIVKKVMADIRQYGTVQRAVLGASVRELDSKIAKEKDITAVKSGLLIASVNDMSTAKELGLQEDDVITAINGVNVANHAQLVEQLNKFRPGDKVTVTYYRDNKKIEKTATLRNQTGSTSITKKGDFSELGCAFMKLTAETKTRLGISNGVQVKGLKDGAIRDAGVKEGFIITAVNDVPVNSSEDVEQVYNSVMKDSDEYKALILYGVYPTGKKYTYAVNLASE
jgi:serine protease Do